MVVASDTPQTHFAHFGGSVVRAQGTHGYGSAIMALLICYLPLRSSARTRRLAACKTAVSALSRRCLLQRIGSWSRKTSVACIVIIRYLLMIAPKFSGCLAVPSGLSPLASRLWPLACSRSVGPKGAKGDSPGQSEAPPWVRLRDESIGSPALGDPFGPNLGGFRGR